MLASCGQVRLHLVTWLSILRFILRCNALLFETGCGLQFQGYYALGYDTRTFTPYIPKAGIILCSVGGLNNIQTTYEQF